VTSGEKVIINHSEPSRPPPPPGLGLFIYLIFFTGAVGWVVVGDV